MTDTIDPEEIAEQTGLTPDEVRDVLAHLVPSWLFASMIDDDLDDVDYMDRRRED